MSEFIPENQESYTKKAWINNLMNDKKLLASLDETYATDVLESVADETYSSLDAAIADLSIKSGLTASEVSKIKRIAIAMVTKAEEEKPCACSCAKSEVPGNVDVPGDRLVKEGPEAVASSVETKTASGMNPGFQAYLDKKKEEREGKKSGESEDKKDEKKEEKKEEVASLKQKLHKAWFQNDSEKPSSEAGGVAVSNSPEELGFPGEIKYKKDNMQTTAPGGQDSRPFEQKHFEESAKETKKVMGPNGEEFKLKVEMQRIPEGEKPANTASSKRLALIKQIVANKI